MPSTCHHSLTHWWWFFHSHGSENHRRIISENSASKTEYSDVWTTVARPTMVRCERSRKKHWKRRKTLDVFSRRKLAFRNHAYFDLSRKRITERWSARRALSTVRVSRRSANLRYDLVETPWIHPWCRPRSKNLTESCTYLTKSYKNIVKVARLVTSYKNLVGSYLILL